ncbi:diaminopimelate decarboxylase family protein [Thermodesulfobacteriota bacterium]
MMESSKNAGSLLKDLREILEQKAPILPQEDLISFIETYFNKRDEYLSLLSENPPPLYMLDSSALKERADKFRYVFEKVFPRVSFFFAVKSNNHPDMARTLLESGFGLDVSSGLELEMALKLDARDIVFSGPGKTDDELLSATLNEDRVTLLMDSFGELQRTESVAKKQNKSVRAGVRLTTNPNGLWRKFGISPDDLPGFWEESRKCPHINIQGLQFHTSWNLSPRAQIEFIQNLGKTLKSMPGDFKKNIDFIDIGGGYWPEEGEWLQDAGTLSGRIRAFLEKPEINFDKHSRISSVPIETFAEEIGSAVKEHIFNIMDCRIFLEPGRWISHHAMHLFLSVIDKKAPDLVITDAGTNAIGWERFETDYFPILNLTRPSLKEKRCNILGSLCTPHDIWGFCYFGEDIRPGDILMIPTQGAYTYSLRQHFIKPVPPVVLI